MAKDRIKKLHLSVNEDIRFFIYGIVTSSPDYKLSLLLNTLLGISLRSDQPLTIKTGHKTETTFSQFSDLSGVPYSWITVIANRSESYRLLKKMQNIDYLILHYNETAEEDNDIAFYNAVKESGFVSGIFSISRSAIDKQLLDQIIPLH
ncbi:MAG: IPExxxVDY family protein [Bacteroidales bacterium]|nr:IPExxxVDY family protein [Bacteroidales bacterium]